MAPTSFVAVLVPVYWRHYLGRAAFVFLLMAAMPLVFHLPAHLLLKRTIAAPRGVKACV